jgi:hypothetical protein
MCFARRRLFAVDLNQQRFRAMARTLTSMATKTKAKLKTCVHCGHTFDPNDRWRDLSDPDWLPAASVYCSHDCSDRYHCDLGHCCSTHMKEKAQREAAKAAR